MFGSSLPPVVCKGTRVLFTLFVFVCAIVVSNTYYVVYFIFFCLRLESCVPNVASFSGLSIVDFVSVFSNSYVYNNSHATKR